MLVIFVTFLRKGEGSHRLLKVADLIVDLATDQ